ncbi:tyrosine aminotransferase-like [Anneissia japonica]|uniref:tyrosine aminotransferase-like n=1 Tax=Anneissia japonica TaxID=1529436 RepID=UPI001425AA82|nr:tyrosine aminotransferase-like [Anneissia japonica]
MATKSAWNIRSSEAAKNTVNPIRIIVDGMKLEPNPKKHLISLSIGDPTKFGNLPLDPCITDAVHDVIDVYKNNGYSPSVGNEEARAAVAKYYSTDTSPLTSKDVILTSGCSGAINIAITVLCNPGDNILIPRPGFLLYRTVGGNIDIETRSYRLLPEKNWEVDLSHLEELIDDKTRCIVVINPSNPCGSVYDKEHLIQIGKVATKHHLPILADEIYAGMVFQGEESPCMADITDVPILSCGGTAKRFLAPGWRIGWLLIHDRHNAFQSEVREGLFHLTTKLLGPCSIMEAALPGVLKNTPKHFFDKTLKILKQNADALYSGFIKIPGITPIMPKGAMYMMSSIEVEHMPNIKDDMDFVQKLMAHLDVYKRQHT